MGGVGAHGAVPGFLGLAGMLTARDSGEEHGGGPGEAERAGGQGIQS